jgi:hypothetical protein
MIQKKNPTMKRMFPCNKTKRADLDQVKGNTLHKNKWMQQEKSKKKLELKEKRRLNNKKLYYRSKKNKEI